MDGLLLVDKQPDMTSHDVIQRVRRVLGQKSVGHTGTLDPLATGLMILVLGEATKLSDYLVMTEKSYQLKVRLGVTTDTLDRTGQILSETECAFPTERLRAEIEKLQGEFQWPVPVFSAAKVGGKKLYEYARKQEEVELPIKSMTFWNIQIEDLGADHAQLTLDCSKGSFVRTWAAKLGEALGVGGVVDELRRLRVGSFHVEQALTLAQLEAGQLQPAFVPMAEALPSWRALIAGPKEARLMANGQLPGDLLNRLVFDQKQAFARREPLYVKVITADGDLLAILAAEPGQSLKIRRVFRTLP